MERLLPALAIGLVLLAGCTMQGNKGDTPSTVTYTNENQNGSSTITVDNATDTYSWEIIYRTDFSGFEQSSRFTKTDAVNMTLDVMCGVLEQAGYNYDEFADRPGSIDLDSANYTREAGGETTQDADFPEHIFGDFTPKNLSSTIYDSSTGQKVGHCRVTGADSIEKDFYTE